MILSLLRYLQGYLYIRIVGYSPERFINLCKHHHITLWGMRANERAYEMYISVKGFRKLRPILKKTNTKVIVKGKYGLPFFLHRRRKRKMFFAGAVLCLVLVYGLSLFVWDIEITGNYTRTDEQILEYLKDTGVVHGMRKKKVDCPGIVKDIRKQFDDIIWVSASLEGTRLKLAIKENSDRTVVPKDNKKETVPKDIVAAKDGIVTRIVTREGTPMVTAGTEVKKGDLLVLGKVDILDDAGTVVDYQYHEADADIDICTTQTYEDEMPAMYEEKSYQGIGRRRVFLKFGDWKVTLGFLKNSYEHSSYLCEEKQVELLPHFFLPFLYGIESVKPYTIKEKKYSDEKLKEYLSARFSRFCSELEKKGVQILENDVKIYKGNTVVKASGTLKIIEPATTFRDTQITPIEKTAEGELK